jgi:hypothetical protein
VTVAASIVIESPAAPHAVLAAIRDDGREWRESVIPPALRAELRHRVVTRVKGERFRLALPSGLEEAEHVTLRGMVSPAPGGGSVVRATFRSGAPEGWAAAAVAGIGLAFWSLSWGMIILAAAAGFAGLDHWRTARLDPDTSATAAYLAERLRAAVSRAAADG